MTRSGADGASATGRRPPATGKLLGIDPPDGRHCKSFEVGKIVEYTNDEMPKLTRQLIQEPIGQKPVSYSGAEDFQLAKLQEIEMARNSQEGTDGPGRRCDPKHVVIAVGLWYVMSFAMTAAAWAEPPTRESVRAGLSANFCNRLVDYENFDPNVLIFSLEPNLYRKMSRAASLLNDESEPVPLRTGHADFDALNSELGLVAVKLLYSPTAILYFNQRIDPCKSVARYASIEGVRDVSLNLAYNAARPRILVIDPGAFVEMPSDGRSSVRASSRIGSPAGLRTAGTRIALLSPGLDSDCWAGEPMWMYVEFLPAADGTEPDMETLKVRVRQGSRGQDLTEMVRPYFRRSHIRAPMDFSGHVGEFRFEVNIMDHQGRMSDAEFRVTFRFDFKHSHRLDDETGHDRCWPLRPLFPL